MFRRRNKQGFRQRMRELLFPARGMEEGWERRIAYYRHRLFRNADSTHKITAALAVGVGVSFTPFLGLHIFMAMYLCWLFRISVFAGIMGTVAGNPWSFPAMYWLGYQTGAAIFGFFGMGDVIAMPEALTLSHLLDHPLKLLLPLTVGGTVCAVLSWPVAYLACYWPVKKMRRTYLEERRRGYEEKLTAKALKAKGLQGKKLMECP